mgnify:CR=1 FL=1
MELSTKTRTRKCEYCGISERYYTNLLDHYYAHFLLQDFRNQNPKLNTGPEKILQLDQFKGFVC